MRKKARKRAKSNPKAVELVESSYQPTKAEKEEEFSIEATLGQLADAVLQPVEIVWKERPEGR